MQTDLDITRLKDAELLKTTKILVENERKLLTKILHHLNEIGRRKLFSDLGYSSLFEYAVKELGYSEGGAGRRIQALKLLNEIPQLKDKIESGSLSLSNISQAQSFFRDVVRSAQTANSSSALQMATPVKLTTDEKINILTQLEGKSTREAQKILLEKTEESQVTVNKERVKVISATHTQVNLIMDNQLVEKLEQIRSLLGPKGATMTMVELIEAMAEISQPVLMANKFGKKRTEKSRIAQTPSQISNHSGAGVEQIITTTKQTSASNNLRYIPKSIKYSVWQRDQGKCCRCRSVRNLNYDHVKPVALGGQSSLQNLRLLCFQCNQRHAIKSFGFRHNSVHK